MRKLTLTSSVFAVLALCTLLFNFEPSAQAQRAAPPSPNDLCSSAIPVGSVGRFRFDSTGATTSADDPCISCCFFGVGQNGSSTWYVMTPPAGGVVRVSTQGSDYDTVVSAWQTAGGCPTGTFMPMPISTCTNSAGVTEITCNDDSAGTLQSDVSFVSNGGTYYVEVAECTGTAPGFGGFNGLVNISVNSR